jgi:CheY-like chemotaxis protein
VLRKSAVNSSAAVPAARILDILVVENHPDTVKYLQMYLEQAGHHVRTALTIREALAKIREQTPDVLLSDIGLPDGDGWSLISQANLPETVYAVAMSGFGMGNDHALSKAAGYRHHLLKPFTPDLLDQYLEEAAQEREARQEFAELPRERSG